MVCLIHEDYEGYPRSVLMEHILLTLHLVYEVFDDKTYIFSVGGGA